MVKIKVKIGLYIVSIGLVLTVIGAIDVGIGFGMLLRGQTIPLFMKYISIMLIVGIPMLIGGMFYWAFYEYEN